MISNVNLIGQGEEVTIIDAEHTGRVIIINTGQPVAVITTYDEEPLRKG